MLEAQAPKVIVFHIDNKTDKINVKTDSVDYKTIKQQTFLKYQLQGYIGLSVKDSVWIKNKLHYTLNFDTHFKHVVLSHQNKKTVTDIEQTPYQINKQLIQLENSGFPFAQISITNQK